MTELLGFAVITLAATLIIGLMPVLRAPRSADRMLAGQLIGTTGVGILLVLAVLLDLPALRNVALVLALLAAVALAAFTRRPKEAEDA
jgi:multicomponent Na+:H+ antiporter subunit F